MSEDGEREAVIKECAVWQMDGNDVSETCKRSTLTLPLSLAVMYQHLEYVCCYYTCSIVRSKRVLMVGRNPINNDQVVSVQTRFSTSEQWKWSQIQIQILDSVIH